MIIPLLGDDLIYCSAMTSVKLNIAHHSVTLQHRQHGSADVVKGDERFQCEMPLLGSRITKTLDQFFLKMAQLIIKDGDITPHRNFGVSRCKAGEVACLKLSPCPLFTARCTMCIARYCCRKSSVRPSVRLSVTLMYRGYISRVSSKVITRIISLGSSLLGATTSAI